MMRFGCSPELSPAKGGRSPRPVGKAGLWVSPSGRCRHQAVSPRNVSDGKVLRLGEGRGNTEARALEWKPRCFFFGRTPAVKIGKGQQLLFLCCRLPSNWWLGLVVVSWVSFPLYVDPGLINPSRCLGGVPSKSGLNPPTKRNWTPPDQNQPWVSQGSLHYTPEHCLVNGGVP